MTTFTFDDDYFFDRQPYDRRWYAFTHFANGSTALRHGHFAVADGTFAGHTSDGHSFDAVEIKYLEQVLREHALDMGLEQFDAHRHRPDHHRPIGRRSDRYRDLIGRHHEHSDVRGHPSLWVALEQLRQERPAYRFTREFMREVFDRAARLPVSAVDEWFHRTLMDTWIYDVGPSADVPTYEVYFEEQIRALHLPTPAGKRRWEYKVIYEVDGVPGLYWAERREGRSDGWEGTYCAEYQGVVLPVLTPELTGADHTFVI